VGQFYFGVLGRRWVKIQSALTVPLKLRFYDLLQVRRQRRYKRLQRPALQRTEDDATAQESAQTRTELRSHLFKAQRQLSAARGFASVGWKALLGLKLNGLTNGRKLE
jgi:hypothetical protein